MKLDYEEQIQALKKQVSYLFVMHFTSCPFIRHKKLLRYHPDFFFTNLAPGFFSCFQPKFTCFWSPTGRQSFLSHLILIFLPQFHSMSNLAIRIKKYVTVAPPQLFFPILVPQHIFSYFDQNSGNPLGNSGNSQNFSGIPINFREFPYFQKK